LILGFDVTNTTALAAVAPVITSRAAIAVSQAWVGDAGRPVLTSSDSFSVPVQRGAGGHPAGNVTLPLWQVWAKLQPRGVVAVLLINLSPDGPRDIAVPLATAGLPGDVDVVATDVWTGAALPAASVANRTLTINAVAGHSSTFVLLSPK